MLEDESIAQEIERIGGEVLNKNEEYNKSRERSKVIFHKMNDLLFEFEKELNFQQSIAEEIMYKQGLLEGMMNKNRQAV